MKKLTCVILLLIVYIALRAQTIHLLNTTAMKKYDTIRIQSHLKGLNVALTHLSAKKSGGDPVLFLHGSSFPSALSFGYRLAGESWMDFMSARGYDVYALDFLGYGNADRYPGMWGGENKGVPVGRAREVYLDVDKAVDDILRRTGKEKLHLIGHSWGAFVANLYASEFSSKLSSLVLFAPLLTRTDSGVAENISKVYETLTPRQRIEGLKGLTPKGKECPLEGEIFSEWGAEWLRSDILAQKFRRDYVEFPAGPALDIEELSHGVSYFDQEKVTVPVLVVRGEWDTYPDNNDGERLFTGLKNAPYKKYVVIEKGTHVLHLEKSRHELYEEVAQFLASLQLGKEAERTAIAVIFEVVPKPGEKAKYLDIAAELKPELQKIRGFISIERFQSLSDPNKLLSLSFWEDEQAVMEWRNQELHRAAQKEGRDDIFKDYRIRVVSVVRDYGMHDRSEAPKDSRSFHGEE